MTDWRSEPPDSAGWWDWRYEDVPVVRLRIVRAAGSLYVRYGKGAYTTWTPLPQGGQWRRVPE